jgi:hypothetical protein
MDSQHRHELEENTLASWLADKIETLKPQLPAILLGVIVLVAAIIGINSWNTTNASATAERWTDFAVALEQGNPDLVDLKSAADNNPGTPVADWADATWADGKLFQASQLFFSNRSEADKAIAEATAVYERLVKSKQRDIAERASYQLGRALELQGKLDDAIKQYGRVTGAFALVAKDRILQLESDTVKESYDWITSAKVSGSGSGVGAGVLDNLDPDNIPLPDMTAEEAESALDTLLQDVDKEEAAESEGAAATEEKIESEASEAEAEVPAEEDATDTEEAPAADAPSTEGAPADKPAAE